LEIPKLYREDLRAYRELLSVRPALQRAFEQMRSALATEQSRLVNADLRDFLRERERRKTGRFGEERRGDADFSGYLEYLSRTVSGTLQIDLRSTVEQLRFPNLYRMMQIKELDKKTDQAAVAQEWKEIAQVLNSKTRTQAEKALVQSLDLYARNHFWTAEKARAEGVVREEPRRVRPGRVDLYPRQILERLFRFSKEKDIDFSKYPRWMQNFRLQIFSAELDMGALLREIDLLEAALTHKLAKTDEEKEIVRRLENFDLLEKLLRVELTLPELNKVLRRDKELRVEVKRYRPEIRKGAGLESLYQKALSFYEIAKQRDKALVANALAGSPGSGNAPREWTVTVMVTGGFHGDGIASELRDLGIDYAVIQPHLTGTDHGERYEKVMAGEHADLTEYFRAKNPFTTKQEALLFREAVETAAPVLITQYGIKPDEIPGIVAKALKSHPVFSGIMVPEVFGTEGDRFMRVTPAASAGLIGVENSTLMPEPVSADVRVSRAVDFSEDAAPPAKDKSPLVELRWNDRGMLRKDIRVDQPVAMGFGNMVVEVGLLPAAFSPEAVGQRGMKEILSRTGELLGGSFAGESLSATTAASGKAAGDWMSNAGTPWSFFKGGILDQKLQAQILQAVPLVISATGNPAAGAQFVHFLGEMSGERPAGDFTPQNPEALRALYDLQKQADVLAMVPEINSPDFAELRQFIAALDRDGLLEFAAVSGMPTAEFSLRLAKSPLASVRIEMPSFSPAVQQGLVDLSSSFGIGFSPVAPDIFSDKPVTVTGWEKGETVLNPPLAWRLWTLGAFARTMANPAAAPSGVTNSAGEAIMNEWFKDKPARTVQEQRVLHVQVSGLSGEDLAAFRDDLVPVLAVLATTPIVSLRLNMNLDKDAAAKFRSEVRDLASASGIRLPEDKFQVFSVLAGRAFTSLAGIQRGEGDVGHFILGPEELVARKVSVGPGIIGRGGYPASAKAPEIARHSLVWLSELLKERLSDRYEVINAERAFPEAFAMAGRILERYLREAIVRVSA
jgi:hypothetical protein